jgi:hypothetical protein
MYERPGCHPVFLVVRPGIEPRRAAGTQNSTRGAGRIADQARQMARTKPWPGRQRRPTNLVKRRQSLDRIQGKVQEMHRTPRIVRSASTSLIPCKRSSFMRLSPWMACRRSSVRARLAPLTEGLARRSWWIVLGVTRLLCAWSVGPAASGCPGRRRAFVASSSSAGWSIRSALVDRSGAIGGVVAGRLL